MSLQKFKMSSLKDKLEAKEEARIAEELKKKEVSLGSELDGESLIKPNKKVETKKKKKKHE